MDRASTLPVYARQDVPPAGSYNAPYYTPAPRSGSSLPGYYGGQPAAPAVTSYADQKAGSRSSLSRPTPMMPPSSGMTAPNYAGDRRSYSSRSSEVADQMPSRDYQPQYPPPQHAMDGGGYQYRQSPQVPYVGQHPSDRHQSSNGYPGNREPYGIPPSQSPMPDHAQYGRPNEGGYRPDQQRYSAAEFNQARPMSSYDSQQQQGRYSPAASESQHYRGAPPQQEQLPPFDQRNSGTFRPYSPNRSESDSRRPSLTPQSMPQQSYNAQQRSHTPQSMQQSYPSPQHQRPSSAGQRDNYSRAPLNEDGFVMQTPARDSYAQQPYSASSEHSPTSPPLHVVQRNQDNGATNNTWATQYPGQANVQTQQPQDIQQSPLKQRKSVNRFSVFFNIYCVKFVIRCTIFF